MMYDPQDELLDRAHALLDLRRPKDAIAFALDHLKQSPDDARAHYLIGAASMQQGELEKALESFTHAVALAPEIPHYQAMCAEVLSCMGDHHAALGILNTAIEQAPELVDLLVIRATVLIRLGDNHAANIDLDRALAMVPDHPDVLRLKAFNVGSIGNNNEARTLMAQALRSAPSDPAMLAGMAWQQYLAGARVDHAEQFRQALRSDPENGHAKYGLRLTRALWPWYHRMLVRMSAKAKGRPILSQVIINGLSLTILALMVYAWKISGYRRDIGIIAFTAPIFLPVQLFLLFPALLQMNLVFSPSARHLLNSTQAIRTTIAAAMSILGPVALIIGLTTPLRIAPLILITATIGTLALRARIGPHYVKDLTVILLSAVAILLSLPFLLGIPTDFPALACMGFGLLLGTTALVLAMEG